MEEFITCSICKKETYYKKKECDFCGASLKNAQEVNSTETQNDLDKRVTLAKESSDYSILTIDEVDRLTKGITLTTETIMQGYNILERIEIISSECVFGMNLFRDIFAGFRDIFGGRSVASQKVLRDARRTCLIELRREALMVGANAVIGVDLDYNEISGAGKSMLFLVATGTAVNIKKDA